jgi:hypothetical protein
MKSRHRDAVRLRLGSTQALLQQYSTMSAEEKKVLGFTDEFANRIMQNYRAMSSLQNSVGSGAGLTAYFSRSDADAEGRISRYSSGSVVNSSG